MAPIICINGGEAKFHLDEYLYVPKRIEDEELDYVKILVAKDGSISRIHTFFYQMVVTVLSMIMILTWS